MPNEDRKAQDTERNPPRPLLHRLLGSDIRKVVEGGLRSAVTPQRRAFWIGVAIVTTIALAIAAAGGFVAAVREVYWALSALFATIGQVQARAEAWSPGLRIFVIVLVAMGLVLYVTVINNYMKAGAVRGAVLLLGISVGLSAATLLVSFRPGVESVPIGPNIGVIILDAEGGAGEDRVEKAIAQSRSFLAEYAERHPDATFRAVRRRPLAIVSILIRNRATAAEDIIAAIKNHNLGYIVLAASPEDLAYSNLLASVGNEAVTFILTPAALSANAHRNSITIFPSPEREGEHMAHEVAAARYTSFVVLRHAGSSSYETRASIRFSQTTQALTGVQPYSSMTYTSAAELRRHLTTVMLTMPERPQFIYLIDSGPLQQIAIRELARHRYTGVVGLSSFALTYVNVQDLPNRFHIALPWPMRRRLEGSLIVSSTRTENVEASNLMAAGVYTASILADHAHHATESLSHRNIVDQIHQLEEFQPVGSVIPFGSISIRLTAQPPKSIFNVAVLRRHHSPE